MRSMAWRDVDWRAHQRREKIEGRWLNLVDIGSGPAVLLVHGLTGCWQNWLENIPSLVGDYRVIAVDLPGFGESEMPARPISISGYARTLDALCDALELDTVRVVGNSLGGFVAAELAIRSPARVEALCLVAAAGLSVERARADRTRGVRHRIENLLFFYIAWLATKFPRLALRPRVRRWMLGLVVAHPEALPGPLIAEQVRGIAKPGFDAALEALTRYPIRDRLGEIACPTLIVWGDEDRLVPPSDAAEFEWLIAGSRKLTYEDTGHAPMLERPERFNRDLRAFLEGALAG
ncbi:MAG TPA: alpha/beta fold hydrolase [Solirubrobacteraceae bacterium]|nr:alpha/beta fold hydrolase [Solirubrobacteraceae bacterium]